jgi:hypothetical protein
MASFVPSFNHLGANNANNITGANLTNWKQWVIGAQFGIAGFTIGGSIGYDNNGLGGNYYTGQASESRKYSAGIMYETGPWQMSFGWGHTNTDNGNGAQSLQTVAQGTTSGLTTAAAPGSFTNNFASNIQNPVGAATFGGYVADKFELGVNYALGPGIKLVGGGIYWNVSGPVNGTQGQSWALMLFSFGRLASHQIDEQRRQIGPRDRQPLGRLARQDGAVVLVIQHQLEQPLLDCRGSRFEVRLSVPVEPVGDVEPDVAATIERGQDLEAPEQQRQPPHREAPIVIRSRMECLGPGCRQVDQAASHQHGLHVACRPLGRLRMLENVAADDEIERLLAEPGLDPAQRGADVQLAIDIVAVGQVDADEFGSTKPLADKSPPVTFVSIRDGLSRPDLENPRRSCSDVCGEAIEKLLDLLGDRCPDDVHLTAPASDRRSAGRRHTAPATMCVTRRGTGCGLTGGRDTQPPWQWQKCRATLPTQGGEGRSGEAQPRLGMRTMACPPPTMRPAQSAAFAPPPKKTSPRAAPMMAAPVSCAITSRR